jgi:hypothetical protein
LFDLKYLVGHEHFRNELNISQVALTSCGICEIDMRPVSLSITSLCYSSVSESLQQYHCYWRQFLDHGLYGAFEPRSCSESQLGKVQLKYRIYTLVLDCEIETEYRPGK